MPLKEVEFDRTLSIGHCKISISRTAFESRINDDIDKAMKVISEEMAYLQTTPADYSSVILAGGSCKLPIVEKKITELFDGKAPTTCKNVDEAVALGATQVAKMMMEGNEIQLTDVTPYSLGLTGYSKKDECEINFPIIKKNSTYPCTAKAPTFFLFKDQTECVGFIMEGDSKVLKDCTKIAKISYPLK